MKVNFSKQTLSIFWIFVLGPGPQTGSPDWKISKICCSAQTSNWPLLSQSPRKSGSN